MRQGQFDARRIACARSPSRACGDRQVGEAHSTTFGTAKKSPARSGALASTLSGIAAVGHHVLAHLQRHVRGAGQRLDAVDVHLVQLLDPAQDAVQLGLQARRSRLPPRGCGRAWRCGGRSRDRATWAGGPCAEMLRRSLPAGGSRFNQRGPLPNIQRMNGSQTRPGEGRGRCTWRRPRRQSLLLRSQGQSPIGAKLSAGVALSPSWPGLTRPPTHGRSGRRDANRTRSVGVDGRVKPGHDGDSATPAVLAPMGLCPWPCLRHPIPLAGFG